MNNIFWSFFISSISFLIKYRLKYLFFGSKVVVEKGGILDISSGVSIRNCQIYVGRNGCLKIERNSTISASNFYVAGENCLASFGSNSAVSNLDLAVWRGRFTLGSSSFFNNGDRISKIRISIDGHCHIGTFNRIRSALWVRFGGRLTIGDHNAINEQTDIRCDERVDIGDYNQISYSCTIWDTNTHCIYPAEKRRKITDQQYPDFGLETEKPVTAPVQIGNDCWLGKGVTLLKGSSVGDRSIIGLGTLISGQTIPRDSTVVVKTELRILSADNKSPVSESQVNA